MTNNYNSHLSIIRKIQNYFYSGGATSAKRQASIKTQLPPEGYQYIFLEINKKTGPQSTGPRLLYNVEFPKEGASLYLHAKAIGKEEIKRFYSGPWAFIRFLDDSVKTEDVKNSVTIDVQLSAGNPSRSIKYTINHLSHWESIRGEFFCPEN